MSAVPPETLASDAECSSSYPYDFNWQFQSLNASTSASDQSKRSLAARDNFVFSLADGVLTSSIQGRGYISSEGRLRFDSPPPTDAMFTSSFSLCSNGSLTLGISAVWHNCVTDGRMNMYIQTDRIGCEPILITLYESAGEAAGSTSISSTVAADKAGPTETAGASPEDTISVSTPLATAGSRNDDALSIGATTGIAVAACICGIVVSAFAFVSLRKRRRRRHARARAARLQMPLPWEFSEEQAVYEKDGNERKIELGGRQIFESGGRVRAAEMSG